MSQILKILPAIAVVLLTLLFIALALWQLERARGKEESLRLHRERALQPAVTVGATVLSVESMRFAPVVLRGVFEPALQFMVDNVVVDGAVGVTVVTPFKPARSDVRVLVNRGWLAWPDRTHLPTAPPPSGEVLLHGVALTPSVGRLRLGAVDPPPPGPWAELDVQQFAALVAYPLQPFVVRLSPGASADGLRRRAVMPVDTWVHRHRAYALQWAALAVALWVLCALWWWRRRR